MRDLMCATQPQAGRAERLKKIALVLAATLVVAGCGKSQNVRGNGNPAGPGPTQKIQLVWKHATNQWKVKLNGGSEQDPKSAHTPLARNTTGPTMFEVSIDGGGSTPPTFASDALWVWEGPGQKSSPQNGIHSTQILGPVLAKDGTLVFWDLNQGSNATLNYQLNFQNGVPPVDPIIDNGGHD
jgi:hypothetical protein